MKKREEVAKKRKEVPKSLRDTEHKINSSVE